VDGLFLHADAFRGLVKDDRQLLASHLGIQKRAQLYLRPNQMDPDGQALAGKNRSANLRQWSFVGAYGVKRNVDKLRHRGLFGGFLDFQNGPTLVRATFGAGVMGQLFLVAVGTLGEPGGGQKVVGAANCRAAR
jgi:hypothetical protein